jgi:hypothetical protein
MDKGVVHVSWPRVMLLGRGALLSAEASHGFRAGSEMRSSIDALLPLWC